MKELFYPKSIAVIGASRNTSSVGYSVLKGLRSGGVLYSPFMEPFPGKIFAINPNADEIQGVKCYKNVLDIKDNIDLVIICIPSTFVKQSIQDCVKKKVKYGIIITAGFGEYSDEGKKLQEEIVDIANKGNMRLVGPNCLGILNTHANLNASFAPTMPPKGGVAFLTQSGALADSIIDWAAGEEYGMSKIVSLGNQSDLSISDFLEYLGNDKETKAIAIYIEGLKDGRRFIKIADKVLAKKPIVVLKAGRSQAGTKAVSSHTGSLAGSYTVYESILKQHGIQVVDTVDELFEVTKALSKQQPAKENGIAIITNGGGCGVLCADMCEHYGVKIVPFKESTIKKLDKDGKMHPAYSRNNPLDIVGDALPERYLSALDIVLGENYIHGAIVIQTLQTMTDIIEDAQLIVRMNKKYPKKPIVCNFMGGLHTQDGIKILKKNNVPSYNDPVKSARVMAALIEWGNTQKKHSGRKKMCIN
ncbi:MAG: acetate--CoA ligase family protein [Candidatus Woesearchaeota archaeon]